MRWNCDDALLDWTLHLFLGIGLALHEHHSGDMLRLELLVRTFDVANKFCSAITSLDEIEWPSRHVLLNLRVIILEAEKSLGVIERVL